MKKILINILVLITGLCSLLAFAGCGHTHDYTELKKTETEHWYECSCGDKLDVENHKGGTATCTERAVCSVCNEIYGQLEDHNYTELKHNEIEHWHECVCGDKANVENHIPGAEATEDTDQKCTICNYVITPALGHVHTLHLTKVDAKPQSCTKEGNIEYYTCTCGKWFTDNTATTEIIDKTSVLIGKDAHNYAELKHNETEHWKECVCGDKENVESHNGGTATCTEQARCKDCGTEYGTPLYHRFGTPEYAWQNDKCTAIRVCANDNTHVETETVTATYVKDTDKTCTTAETGHYVATFENSAFTTQTTALNSVTVGTPLYHRFGTPEYTWQNDKCTAIRVCANDNTHVETETVTATYVKDTDATETTVETGHYVATFENLAFATQCTELNSVTVCEALGHIFTEYQYNEDAKCETNGTETAICDRLSCNETYTREKEGTALEHVFQKTDKIICCTLSEYQGYKCSLCSTTKQELIGVSIDYVSSGNHNLPDFHDSLSIGDTCKYCGGKILDKEENSLVIKVGDLYQVEHYSGQTHNFSSYSTVINSAYISNQVTNIYNQTFYNYSALTSINIPDSVTGIGRNAFKNCVSLEEFEIPGKVTIIAERLFYGCSNLSQIVISNSATKIEKEAFYNCGKLTTIVVPSSVNSIGKAAFGGCVSLEQITLPFIGETKTTNIYFGYIFGANDYTENNSKIPSQLKLVNITDSGKIGEYAFYGCENLTRVNATISSIGYCAFYGCVNLKTIVLPNTTSVIGISNYAFTNCNALEMNEYDNAYYLGSTDNPYYLLVKAKNKNITSCTVHNDTRYIHSEAFRDCTRLTTVNLGGATSVYDYAFYGCSSLTSVNLRNVYELGNYTFARCSKIQTINIQKIDYIGTYTFAWCTSLQYADVFFGVIKSYAFYQCTALKSVYFDNIKYTIRDHAFDGCTNLEQINSLYSVAFIGEYAFNNCSKLKSILLRDDLTEIGSYAFYNCSSLKDIKLGSKLEFIGIKAFYGCTNLTATPFAEGVMWNLYTNPDDAFSYVKTIYLTSASARDLKDYSNYYWKRH